MSIRLINQKDIKETLILWNQCLSNPDFLYKRLDETTFKTKFMNHNSDFETITYLSLKDDQINGFASGVHMFNKDTAYITAIVVSNDYKRQGIATSLLKKLEDRLLEINPNLKKIDIVFFNPINLEWIIPNTDNHDHPNAPGVDIISDAYLFFKACGYSDFAYQNSYYKDISQYEFTDKTLDKIKRLKDNEIKITLFDKNKHHGFDELFIDLKSEAWKNEINETIKNEMYPVLIAEKKGLIIGFSGPLKVQPSMRGYFTGIGIHSGYRGFGAGSVLFSGLCKSLKDIGAHYMTLFTGENNPARNIYEKEGFKIVRSWVDMRKEVQK